MVKNNTNMQAKIKIGGIWGNFAQLTPIRWNPPKIWGIVYSMPSFCRYFKTVVNIVNKLALKSRPPLDIGDILISIYRPPLVINDI